MLKQSPPALLSLPTGDETSIDFKQRLQALLLDSSTHLYVDTSFLMWLTKVGSASRNQLTDWLLDNCGNRVHVPAWAAHEYLKHHVAGTISEELGKKLEEVKGALGGIYTYCRPFVDEATEKGHSDPVAARATARDAINTLADFMARVKQWTNGYQRNAVEVISFINTTAIGNTPLFDYFETLSSTGDARYVGSVPPGFQDRGKKGKLSASDEGDDEKLRASNKFGDLVFWKEILAHAASDAVHSIVILTNDRKNDWRLGGGAGSAFDARMLEMRKNWTPLPRPHPMLALEARLSAHVAHIEVLDSVYLGAVLDGLAPDIVKAFVDVATVADAPGLGDSSKTTGEKPPSGPPEGWGSEPKLIFAEAKLVSAKTSPLRRALIASRDAPKDNVLAFVQRLLQIENGMSLALSDAFDGPVLENFSHNEFVSFARLLHDAAIEGSPGYVEKITDFISALDRFPVEAATSIYLGFLASAYLIREKNETRLPPRSPVAELLFARQAEPYAQTPIALIEARLRDNEFQPIYLPSADAPTIPVEVDIQADTDALDEICSFKVNGVELLIAGQVEESLNLRKLFPEPVALSVASLAVKACEIFTLPFSQLEFAPNVPQTVTFNETSGFKRPGDVYFVKDA
ncbi:PIN-like domain-containing protein [Aliirhizobium smilacinae]|uniref:PIN like domain-containing protein n=1 Tax=Aliirhizobium smilacinae TaxID=1395944 RepID=A0A5C4XAN0_9HYPH|nr:PIN-like domain-containing protein [Rhizobium smilacinae]TNM59871.1 hypothetical protein FHP24_27250 [Rhizobium smilacinae]